MVLLFLTHLLLMFLWGFCPLLFSSACAVTLKSQCVAPVPHVHTHSFQVRWCATRHLGYLGILRRALGVLLAISLCEVFVIRL